MNNTLSKKDIWAIGLMLFALFFGAGNMIFPPALGQAAGTNVWIATLGFLITGVGLPLLGVIAVSRTNGDFTEIAKRAHPIFGIFFTIILYLAIGPLFGIPRTGTVAYEIGVTPFLTEGLKESPLSLMLYTLIFFGITLWLALNPSKMVDRVGKILTPLLLGVLALLVIKSLITPMGEFQTPQGRYTESPFIKGFIDGYLTMDTIAALVFGIVVITSIKAKGVTNQQALAAVCIKAGLIAAAGLVIVYAALSYIGASSPQAIGLQENGGAILTSVATHLFGALGTSILGLAITFACLTTSVGLTTACGEFFAKLLPGVSYKTIVILLTVFSAVIANIGLTQLISISIPILIFVYPLAIILVLLSFGSFNRAVYVWPLIVSSIISLMDSLKAFGITIDWIDQPFQAYLPFYTDGAGWIVPAAIAAVIGYITGKMRERSSRNDRSTVKRVS
jgi:LIVCS family branched-chain amino acid:cation transporter